MFKYYHFFKKKILTAWTNMRTSKGVKKYDYIDFIVEIHHCHYDSLSDSILTLSSNSPMDLDKLSKQTCG